MAKFDVTLFIGKQFNLLTVVADAGVDKRNRTLVTCNCECGNSHVCNLSVIVSGRTKSCGCLYLSNVKTMSTHHGKSSHPLCSIWSNLMARCYRRNSISFKNYGARGIYVCDEWRNSYISFYKWAMDNGWEKGLNIDRRENDGPYSPSNCRVVSVSKNMRNKRNNHMLTFNGVTKTMMDWSEETGIPYDVIKSRINKFKWPTDKALTASVAPRRRQVSVAVQSAVLDLPA